MNQVEKDIIAKVTNVLNKFNLKYAIKDSDGTIHGELKPEQAKPKKQAAIYGYGVMKSHLESVGLPNLKVNTHMIVPSGTYDVEIVRRSVCSYASQHWGNATYKTKITPDRKGIEITRFDKETAEFMKKDPLADLLDGWN